MKEPHWLTLLWYRIVCRLERYWVSPVGKPLRRWRIGTYAAAEPGPLVTLNRG